MESVKIVIPLPPVTKKNSSQIITVGGKPRLIPSKKYREYEKATRFFLKPLNIDYPINVKCIFYMPTRRRVDLTNLLSAVADILVAHGVVTDDNRDIIASHDGSIVLYDKKAPRTEIEITKISNYEKWSS